MLVKDRSILGFLFITRKFKSPLPPPPILIRQVSSNERNSRTKPGPETWPRIWTGLTGMGCSVGSKPLSIDLSMSSVSPSSQQGTQPSESRQLSPLPDLTYCLPG
ncbi:hypothetical protein BaRGS_00025513 [Batillaria attramentaria]|uniref:Uncharacterized protein n=1 Tax=Batillaria attramentaria TaxID=370345 RepID=A0ABD0K814_9CAEN